MNAMIRIARWLFPRSIWFMLIVAVFAWGFAIVVAEQLQPTPDAIVRMENEKPIALLDDGRMLTASANADGVPGKLSLRNGSRTEKSILHGRTVLGVAANEDSDRIAIVAAEPMQLLRWPVDADRFFSTPLPVDFPVHSAHLVWSKDDAIAIDLRGAGKTNKAMLVTRDNEVRPLPGAAAPFAFSSDRSLLASVDSTSIMNEVPKVEKAAKAFRVLVWNRETRDEPRSFSGFDGMPLFMEFSPSGDKLTFVGRWTGPNWTKESPDTETWDVATGAELGNFGPIVALPTDDMRVIWYTGQAERGSVGVVNYLTWEKHDDKSFRMDTPRYWATRQEELYLSLHRTPNTAYFLGEGFTESPAHRLASLRLPKSVIDWIQKQFGGAKRRGIVANAFDIRTGARLAEVSVPSADWTLTSSPSGYAIALLSPDGTEARVYRLPHGKRWGAAIAIGLGLAFALVTLLRLPLLIARAGLARRAARNSAAAS